MSLSSLRFRPPDHSYDGFKFRMALVLCLVFGFFGMLFLGKHLLVINDYELYFLPAPVEVVWNYLRAYYVSTLFHGAEFALIVAGFGATFWLNWPKEYFSDRYRDYGKERTTPEARSFTWLLTLTAFALTLLSIPFLTLHFPLWVSLVFKFGPVALGVLRYLSMIPETRNIERITSVAKLDWDARSLEPTYSLDRDSAFSKELQDCRILFPENRDFARRFIAQGSATVTWSGVDALYTNLEAWLGVSKESLGLYQNAACGIEFALGELLDARGEKPALILTTDAEDPALIGLVEHDLQPIYHFELEKARVKDLLWNNASSAEIVSALAKLILEKSPTIALLSHVFADTGTVLDLKQLVDLVRGQNGKTLFVIDGSHAMGNIVVDDDTFVRCEYYVFNGHNRLLGLPEIGVLVRNRWLLQVAGVPAVGKASGDVPFTYEGMLPWFAFNYLLKHEWLIIGAAAAFTQRKRLADLFRDEMHKRDIRIIGISGESTTVVITGIQQIQMLHRVLTEKGVRCAFVSAGSVTSRLAKGIRFCFHHYHGDDDVRDLAELVGDFSSGEATEPLAWECRRLDNREMREVSDEDASAASKSDASPQRALTASGKH